MAALPGVAGARLNVVTGRLVVEGESDPRAIQAEGIIEGYRVLPADAAPQPGASAGAGADWERRRVFISLGAIIFGHAAQLALGAESISTPLFLLAAAVGGWGNFRKAVRSVPRLDFNMAVLMSVAIVGAVAIGELEEAAVVAMLFAVSEMLEAWSLERARRSIRELMDIAPRSARVERGGRTVEVPVEDIAVGDVMLVRPGEKIAMDGAVLSGASAVDEATITGESIPADKAAGDEVYAGTLNTSGALRIEVTKCVEDTTIARVIHLVEEAQANRAPSQAFVERFAGVYTPAVIGLAVLISLGPPLLLGRPWEPWIYRALALLVVSCPCALVVSTPVAVVSAISRAARRGVLIKGGTYLEQMGSLRALAVDKTGTLTLGRPVVRRVIGLDGREAAGILAEAAAVESHSEHPLACAILAAAHERRVDVPYSAGFAAAFGEGASALIGNRRVRIGNLRSFGSAVGPEIAGHVADLEAEGETVLLLGNEEGPYGLITVSDRLREGVADSVRHLREAGIEHVVILTGDNRRVAAAVAQQVGADRYEAELLPQDKLAAVEKLLAEYGRVAMVGDGVNDAPALAAATVGIAMGGAGSDTALETADVALLADDLSQLPFTLRLSRRALATIKQNIGFALGIKLLAVLAVFPGWLTLWLAILADMGASVIVTLWGMRLLRET